MLHEGLILLIDNYCRKNAMNLSPIVEKKRKLVQSELSAKKIKSNIMKTKEVCGDSKGKNKEIKVDKTKNAQ